MLRNHNSFTNFEMWGVTVHRHRCRMEEIVNRRAEEEARSSSWDEVTG
jgi:hypothetical protein